jgi:hypothetical protein
LCVAKEKFEGLDIPDRFERNCSEWSRYHDPRQPRIPCKFGPRRSKCLSQLNVCLGINQITRDQLGKPGVAKY